MQEAGRRPHPRLTIDLELRGPRGELIHSWRPRLIPDLPNPSPVAR